MKIVFMGSPDFAVPSLEALVEARFDVRLVVTQPDRPAGRGRKMLPTAVKAVALEHGLPVMDFGKGDRRKVTEAVMAEKPDAVVVVAFGHILREPLLSGPPLGCINVHASLLPRWRGVSPVQYSIMHGDSWSGVTIMRMDEGVDTGPILAQRSLGIGPRGNRGRAAGTAGRPGRRRADPYPAPPGQPPGPRPAPEQQWRRLRPQADPVPLVHPLGCERGQGAQPDQGPVALARHNHLPGGQAAEGDPGPALLLPGFGQGTRHGGFPWRRAAWWWPAARAPCC